MTCQLIDSGACRQADVIRTFGVTKSSVARAIRRYRAEGIDGFLPQRRGRRGGKVLTPGKLVEAQVLLDEGLPRGEVARMLEIKPNTFGKAVGDGRLREPAERVGADKSTRSARDATAAAGLGTACTRVEERTLAAVGLVDGATIRFERCRDVPLGGVLCALPALLANGLLDGTDQLLNRLHGYYLTMHVMILLGFMALCRIKTVEQLRGHAPGEFGRLMGLDRIPEVRCLRRKLGELAADGAAEKWAAHLSQQWLRESDPETVGTLYVDGHVRVYHGSATALPRRYVSRQRLCLRGTTDYWVNDGLGMPFFAVEKAVDPGLIEVLRTDIVPRLLRDVPDQPSERELREHPHRCRFVLVFDREGYSPAFFGEMWREHRVACITYHKHPRGEWPEQWFRDETVTMPGGETVTMPLAEMGSLVGSGKEAMWMREVRKLTDSGHQVSLIGTAFEAEHHSLAARLFTRWCQENFFRYMMQHFALDLLGEYETKPLPDTERVVNPEWRELNRRRNSLQGKLTRRNARFAALTRNPQSEDDPARFGKWLRAKSELLEEIENYERDIATVKEAMGGTERHIQYDQLPDEHKFEQLAPTRRHLLETVRMVAYRAETAMVPLITDEHTDSPAARSVLQTLFTTAADIVPEPERKRLRIRLHRSSTPATDRRIQRMCHQLNQTETTYPGTDLTIVYEMVAEEPPIHQNGVTDDSSG